MSKQPQIEIPENASGLLAAFLMQLIAVDEFPPPVLEYRFAGELMRKWRFDLAWPDRMIAVELEGGAGFGGRHTRIAGFREDCHKYNAAALMGWTVLRGDRTMIDSGYLLEYLADAMRGLTVPTLRKVRGTKSVYRRPVGFSDG